MKKLVLLFIFAFIVVTALFSQSQNQYDDENDFRIRPSNDGRTAEIIRYAGTKQAVRIPPRIQGMTVTRIGDEVFKEKELISVTIPNGVTVIGDGAFANNFLTSVTIPNGVISIGYYAFSECSSLTSITIPSSARVIDGYAFSGCSSLASITIPSSVTEIGNGAFSGCNSLTSVTVDNRNSAYASIDGVLFDKNIRTLIIYPPCRNQSTYVIPSSVTTIGDYAFSGCSSLTSITIPSSVMSIGGGAGGTFSGCSSLTSVTVDNRNTAYASIDGVLFDKSIRTIITYPAGKTARTYNIPSSVTEIGFEAFAGCSSLTSVTIPSSVTSIGVSAFVECSSLTSVTIPSSVMFVDAWAFDGCSSLTSITLSRRTLVREWAFPETARIIYRD